MADWLTRKQRSFNMASIRSSGNRSTEHAFRKLLRSSRIKGWRRHVKLAGKPDFVFGKQRLAVFVDGCFWHGCSRCYRLPEDNGPYWKSKVLSNRDRDRRNSRRLRTDGWMVLRFWEHALEDKRSHERIVRQLRKALTEGERRAAHRREGARAG